MIGELGITAVFVTHDQAEAFALGDRVAVLHEGRIAQVDEPSTLYRSPVDRWTATFVGDASFVPGTLSGTRVETPFGTVEVSQDGSSAQPAEGPVDVLVRPEQVGLASGGTTAVVVESVFGGSTSSVVVDANG